MFKCLTCFEFVPEFANFCEGCGSVVLPGGGSDLSDAAPAPAHTRLSPSPSPSPLPDRAKHCRCAQGSTNRSIDSGGYCDNYCENCGQREVRDEDRTTTLSLGASTGSATHRGRRHVDNQDAVAMCETPSGVAIALADGVSSSSRARQAADIAVTTSLDTLRDHPDTPCRARLTLALQTAHDAICRLPYDPDHTDTAENGGQAGLAEPQATVVLALVEANRLWFAWVGDARIYVFGKSSDPAVTEPAELAESIDPAGPGDRQLTIDDSWVNEQVAKGVPLTVAQNDSNAHCITQCLGMRDQLPQVHVEQIDLADGELVMLCSDGLWNYCDAPDAMIKQLQKTQTVESLSQRCSDLVDFANACGGNDNITVALYRHTKVTEVR